MKEFDGIDSLREQQILVDGVPSDNGTCIRSNARERYMRPKRSVVGLPIDVEEQFAQRRQLIGGWTIRP